MFAYGWLKTRSLLLFLLFLIFKKKSKCLMWFRFCFSGRVNKGHCWLSSGSPGKGLEREYPSLPGELGWAGNCPVLNESSSTHLQLSQQLETRAALGLCSHGRPSDTPCRGLALGTAHVILATPNPGTRSFWSCSWGLSFSPSPLPSTIYPLQSLLRRPSYLPGTVSCVHGHVSVLS